MKKTHTIRAFLAGVLVTLFVVGIVPSTLAAGGKNVEIFPGINIYIDDQKLNPTDANGNPVEAFIYNGSTYLPVRAISNALGIPIQWEGATTSVYVGKHSGDSPAAWLSQTDYFSGTSSVTTAATEKDNTGVTHAYCITNDFERTYLLNGQYSRITGTMYQAYEYRSYNITAEGKGIYIYGDGNLLYSYSPDKGTEGMKPVNFSVDLTGVLELKVVFQARTRNGYGTPVLSLGEVGLWT